MATRGKKTAILAGACSLAALLGAVLVCWDDVVVEWNVRRLHSQDRQVQERAATILAGQGAGVVPRLLRELRTLPRMEWEDAVTIRFDEERTFDLGLVETVVKLGEPGVVALLPSLADSDLRVASTAAAALVSHEFRNATDRRFSDRRGPHSLESGTVEFDDDGWLVELTCTTDRGWPNPPADRVFSPEPLLRSFCESGVRQGKPNPPALERLQPLACEALDVLQSRPAPWRLRP